MMGRGMIEPVDIMSNQPFDADLIDYLAVHLRDHRYDLKEVIAVIATSDAYQRQTVVESKDANHLVFRGPVAKRLTAEQFVDAVWQLTGTSPSKPNAQIEGALRIDRFARR